MREIVKLESTAKTGTFYTIKRKRTTTGEKIQLKKFDKKINKHVLFVEKKISK